MSAHEGPTSIVDSVLGFFDRRGFLGGNASKQNVEEQKLEDDLSVVNSESQL